MADAKKKKAKVAQRKYKKEKEIARCMKAGENRSNIESELESEDPTKVDDMIFSEEKESQEVVVSSVERRNPAAMSTGDEQEAKRCGEVPCRGSVLRARMPSANRRQSGCGHCALWRRCWSHCRLWQTWPSKLGGPRSGLALVHRWD